MEEMVKDSHNNNYSTVKVVETKKSTPNKKTVKKTTTTQTNNKGRSVTPKKVSTAPKKLTAKQREELLLENFVGLQRVMVNLSIKFGTLSDNISKLLEVFELSARDQLGKSTKEEDTELLGKINSLLDQNKTIAKGLVLIEEKVRDRGPVQRFQPNYNSQGNQFQQQKKSLPRI